MLSFRPCLAVRALRTAHRDLVLKTAALLLVASALTAGEARASDVEAARRYFAEGVRLLEAGDAEGARRLFLSADAEHHAPAIVYNLAVAEERLSHPQTAVDAYEAYLAEVEDEGNLSAAARAAITQIKARSTRLRIETRSPGARITVDGFALAKPSPIDFLVPAGRHLVVATGEDWHGEASIDVTGTGDTFTVAILPSAPAVPSAAAAPSAEGATSGAISAEPPPPAPPPNGPYGLVWGASFAVTPYHLFGASSGANQREATQLMAGALFEIGGAVSDRVELLARGLAVIGPEAKPSLGPPMSYAIMGGPGASIRVGSSIWLGATFLGGRLETVAHDAFYDTDLVFGAMAEASLAVISSRAGEYVIGAQPGVLLASASDNTAFFFPVTFGYRAY